MMAMMMILNDGDMKPHKRVGVACLAGVQPCPGAADALHSRDGRPVKRTQRRKAGVDREVLHLPRARPVPRHHHRASPAPAFPAAKLGACEVDWAVGAKETLAVNPLGMQAYKSRLVAANWF